MHILIKITFIGCLLILGNINSYAQEYSFKYQRSLDRVTDSWHKIQIPNEAYSKLNSDFSDVRILGVMTNGDTIEAPYILKVLDDTYDNHTIGFNLINEVSKSNTYYYTFEIADDQFVNSVELKFNRSNFDWWVNLEGSQNQQEWFNIIDKSRIVGIENRNTSYSYTKIEFGDVKYKYLRLIIPSSIKPQFTEAFINKKVIKKGTYNSPVINTFQVIDNDNINQTEILVSLKEMLPISFINLAVSDSIDYYRPITVQYATDSIKNKNGWQYLYKTLFTSTLSSLNKQGHVFPNRVIKHLKIIVKNGNNEPLDYRGIKLHGNTHELIARFDKPANYYLVYGNKRAYVPNYDITRFENNIPNNNKILIVGNEILIKDQKQKEKQEPFFKNSLWLWAIMIIIIFILGWFAVKMLKE